jgi:hypothetical protein
MYQICQFLKKTKKKNCTFFKVSYMVEKNCCVGMDFEWRTLKVQDKRIFMHHEIFAVGLMLHLNAVDCQCELSTTNIVDDINMSQGRPAVGLMRIYCSGNFSHKAHSHRMLPPSLPPAPLRLNSTDARTRRRRRRRSQRHK